MKCKKPLNRMLFGLVKLSDSSILTLDGQSIYDIKRMLILKHLHIISIECGDLDPGEAGVLVTNPNKEFVPGQHAELNALVELA